MFSSIHEHLKQGGQNTGGGGFNPTRFSDFPDGYRHPTYPGESRFSTGGGRQPGRIAALLKLS